jgi:hypothetical protein
MTAQDNVAIARSLADLYNSHQSDPAWLEKSVVAFATDSQHTNVPLGATLPGAEGYKQFVGFFAEAFPDSRKEVTNVFATEDQLVIEYTGRGTNICPREIFQRRGAGQKGGSAMSYRSGMGRLSVTTPITIR